MPPRIRFVFEYDLLFIVFHNFIVHYTELDSCLFKHLNGICIGVVAFFAHNPFDARVNYHHGAGAAWRHFTEQRSAFQGYSKPCGLEDCILLGMKRANTVHAYFAITVSHLTNVMACIRTVR
jgi:hypothetical protein